MRKLALALALACATGGTVAYRSRRRCLWLALFVVWAIGAATATRAETFTGSGVVIGADGTILTAAHVIKDCQNLTVRSSSSVSQGYLVARDDDVDLAAVRSDFRPPSYAAVRDGSVRAGDSVVALGYPYAGLLAKTANLTTGTVSALAGLHDDPRFLQISAPIQPGNSGGPLLDASGHLIGIVDAELNSLIIAKATGSIPQNVNFAINTAVIRTFLDRKRISYQTARSEQQLSSADVGEIGQPFTVELVCRGNSNSNPNNDTTNTPTPIQPPVHPPVQQVKVLPACDSPGVTNVLIKIGLNNRIAVFSVQGRQVSATADARYCTAWVSSNVGRRIVNYTVTWTSRETSQFWVQVTWYSGPQPYSGSPSPSQPPQPTQPNTGSCWTWWLGRWVWAC